MSKNQLIPSLNGLRTVSVLIVAASHCGWGSVVPGGLGVTIFFFLSGYLISTLLTREFSNTEAINFKAFYARRVARLSPPLVISLLVAMMLTWAGLTTGGVTIQGTSAQLLYFANYYGLFWDTRSTVPGGTAILWSLAVEEHFYIIYPVMLLALLRMRGARTTVYALLAMCLLVLCWRLYLAAGPGEHADRINYATDTRFDSLLWGCVLGVYPALLKHYSKWSANRLLLAGLTLMAISLLIRNEYFRNTFRYTLQGIALVPVFISLLIKRNGLVFRLLNTRLMSKCGEYSYSFYLIHFVLIDYFTKTWSLDRHPLAMFGLVVVLSFAYAAILFELVESPIKIFRQKFVARVMPTSVV